MRFLENVFLGCFGIKDAYRELNERDVDRVLAGQAMKADRKAEQVNPMHIISGGARRMRTIVTLPVLLFLIGCTASGPMFDTNYPTRMLSDKWGDWTGSWNKSRSEYKFVIGLEEIDGQVAVCGIRATKGIGNKRINQKRMADLRLIVDGQVLIRNLSYFSLSTNFEDPRVTPANCKITEYPWSREFARFKTWEVKSKGKGSYRL